MRTTWPTSSGTSYLDSGDLANFPSWQAWLSDHAQAVAATAPDTLQLTTTEPIVTSWRCNGQPHTVETYWNGTETKDQWVKRHFDRVQAEMANCPP